MLKCISSTITSEPTYLINAITQRSLDDIQKVILPVKVYEKKVKEIINSVCGNTLYF